MRILLFLHLIGASIWLGGHLILALKILPPAWRARDPAPIRAFEKRYEALGLPALLLQVITGIWLATLWLPASAWLSDNPLASLIRLKLGLLALTLMLGAHARLRLIPRLSGANLGGLAVHIYAITLTALALVWVGVSFRFGGVF
ncbi:MAG: copper transporter [Pseudomonadales bacterium RIFCSPLOWO2_12_59_9]|nr:MAG: copper transporter [Pseudomonadales bacterium RIFCSPLOWO2_12_59_9]